MNSQPKRQLKFYFFSCLAILIFSLAVLSPSFNLAFQDDDWRGVVLPKTDYADGRLFTPYGIQLWFCSVLYDLFGSNFYLYYAVSFLLRNLTAFGILALIFILTKDRLASFLGALLFAVSLSGLQTSYETASTNVYIFILFSLIFVAAFFKSRDKFSLRNSAVLGLSLLLATLASPVRAYPLYAWAAIAGGIRILMNFNRPGFKIFLIRLLAVAAVFSLLYYLGLFGWFSLDMPPGDKINDLAAFFSKWTGFISGLNYHIFLNFLRSLGNVIFPGTLDQSGVISTIMGAALPAALITCLYFAVKKRDERMLTLFAFLLWPLLFFSSYFIVILAGYSSAKETIILESTRRYLLPPFIGFSIAGAIALSLRKKNKFGALLLISAVFLIFIHAIGTYTFLSKLSKQRDGLFMVKIWKQLEQSVPESALNPKRRNIFYFETDGSARAIYTVNDGFIPHAVAMYKIKPASPSSAAEISAFGRRVTHTLSFEELVFLIEKGFPDDPQPVGWDRIFAFRVEGERLTDIKEEVKKRVEQKRL